jgi:hypothetical protein
MTINLRGIQLSLVHNVDTFLVSEKHLRTPEVSFKANELQATTHHHGGDQCAATIIETTYCDGEDGRICCREDKSPEGRKHGRRDCAGTKQKEKLKAG